MSQTNSTGSPLNPSDQNYNNLTVSKVLTANLAAGRSLVANSIKVGRAVIDDLTFPTIRPAVIFDNIFAASGPINQAVVYGGITTLSVQFVALQSIPASFPAMVIGRISNAQLFPLVDASTASFTPDPPQISISSVAGSTVGFTQHFACLLESLSTYR